VVVDSITNFHGFTKSDVLSYAAALEQSSNHILASAIVERAKAQKVKLSSAKQVKESSGYGLSGRLGGKTILVGRLSFMHEENVTLPTAYKTGNVKATASYVAVDGVLAGVITFIDEVRPETKNTLERLKRAGITHTLMLTGDNEATAKAVAKQVGITDVVADCLPAGKLHALDALTARPVAFVGDGVNDAPVLTAADVGIALGARGSTAASESADVVILQDDVSKVAASVEIAQRTFFIARQSILIGIFISIGLMGIFATGRFRAVEGAAIQELVDIVVILNALRAHSRGKIA
jgi:P-type E1-E2 ATPase